MRAAARREQPLPGIIILQKQGQPVRPVGRASCDAITIGPNLSTSEERIEPIRTTVFRGLPVIVGVLACAAAGAAVLARSIEITNHVVLVAAAFAPYLMLGTSLAVAVFLIGKRWILAGVAGALTVAMLVIQLPDDTLGGSTPG